MDIKVHFFGKPEIYISGEKVQIQQKKIQALFLYILFNVNCTRDELSAMFWCDCSEEDAKRNLRNAVYKLKNLVGEDILVTAGNTYIQLHPELSIWKDIDIFITEDSEAELLQFGGLGFLDNFYVKNCPEFERWVASIRVIYEKMVLERLKTGLRNSAKTDDTALTEGYARKILAVDPYQEEACRCLMTLYGNRGAYNDAAKIYTAFAQTLKNDLDVEPEAETTELYQGILRLKKGKLLDGRGQPAYSAFAEAVMTASAEYARFGRGEAYRNCIFSGDIGMGKSKAIETFLADEGVTDPVRIRFETTGSGVSYYSVEKIIEVLCARYHLQLPCPNYSDRAGLDIHFLKAMERIAACMGKSGGRELIVLENMESVDEKSMDIVLSYLFDKFYRGAFIVGEYCGNFRADRRMMEKLSLMPNNLVLPFTPPDLSETMEIASAVIGGGAGQAGPDLAAVHQYTRGNMMFLQEVLQNIRAGEPDIYAMHNATLRTVTELLSSLDVGEGACLQLICMFRDGAELGALTFVTGRESMAILDDVERLYHRGLVEEARVGGHLVVRAASQMLRRLVYERFSTFRRAELHSIIANYCEERHKQAPKDYFYISALHEHFSYTQKPFQRIYYALLDLQFRLDYCDELFPTIRGSGPEVDTLYLNRSKAYDAFAQLGGELAELEDILPVEQLCELKMLLCFLHGRTLIRDGKRDKGIEPIRELIFMAQGIGRDDMLLKGYIETIFYGIKDDDEPLMRKYVAKAGGIAQSGGYERETGILLRLEALCDIRTQNYERAEQLLLKSIETFESPRLKSSNYIGVSAAYDYLALICRNQKRYKEAKEYLQRAIALCKEKNVKKSLDVFYEDYGYILFLEGRFQEAKEYFKTSAEIYDTFGTYWLRSVGESCMAMISLHEGDAQSALEHFRRAEIFSKKDMTKEELEVLATARGMLREQKVIT